MEKQTVKKEQTLSPETEQAGCLLLPLESLFIFVFIIPIIYSIYISLFQNKLIGGQVFVGLSIIIKNSW